MRAPQGPEPGRAIAQNSPCVSIEISVAWAGPSLYRATLLGIRAVTYTFSLE